LVNSNGDNGTFPRAIYPVGAGVPRPARFTSAPVIIASHAGGGWHSIGLANPGVVLTGDFYFGIVYNDTSFPLIGADPAANGRAWKYNGNSRTPPDHVNAPFTLLMLTKCFV
jgi:hypothetical protein